VAIVDGTQTFKVFSAIVVAVLPLAAGAIYFRLHRHSAAGRVKIAMIGGRKIVLQKPAAADCAVTARRVENTRSLLFAPPTPQIVGEWGHSGDSGSHRRLLCNGRTRCCEPICD
jgi:hypothetical protein